MTGVAILISVNTDFNLKEGYEVDMNIFNGYIKQKYHTHKHICTQ